LEILDCIFDVRITAADALGASQQRYVLGLKTSDSTRLGNQLLAQTTYANFGTNGNPQRVTLYRTANDVVALNLTYHTQSGKRGALSRKSYDGFYEDFDYQNGVLSSVTYPTGPAEARTINSNGTVASETNNGVTSTFLYDGDRRLTRIISPLLATLNVAYGSTTATVTQGLHNTTYSYDAWGRLAKTETDVDGQLATTRFTYDGLDHPISETTPRGLNYTMTYDVEGRLLIDILSNQSLTRCGWRFQLSRLVGSRIRFAVA
jgi:YD repeat-containing protein